MSKDVKIEKYEKHLKQITQNQNINITRAVVGNLGEGEKININYQPIMIVHEQDKTTGAPLSDIEELMWTILESLPPPKMENLRKLATKTCINKVKSTNAIARYLDFQRTYVSRLKREISEDPVFGEPILALPEPE